MKLVQITMIVAICMIAGCTRYHAKIDGAEIDMSYFLQDKRFKSFTYDPNTSLITIENFGSETSQIVESAIEAALGGEIK